MKGCIVVAFYDSVHCLRRLIDSCELYGTNGYDIVVVNNQSETEEAINYLAGLTVTEFNKFKLFVFNSSRSNYEAGSLIDVYRHFPNYDNYLLLQDSMHVTGPNMVQQFEAKLSNCDVSCYCHFQPVLLACSEAHQAYILSVCGQINKLPDSGIFGSCILITRTVLDDLNLKGYLSDTNIPTCKMHSESWERILAIILFQENYKVEPLINNFDVYQIQCTNPYLRKEFMGRQ